MATFRVFHNYGSEGWKSVGDFADIHEAVCAREADLSNCGGESIIVEVIDVIDAYRRADYERDRKARVKPEVV